jgi:hypothetical protein
MSIKTGVKQITAFTTSDGSIFETYQDAIRTELENALYDALGGSGSSFGIDEFVAAIAKNKIKLLPLIKAVV